MYSISRQMSRQKSLRVAENACEINGYFGVNFQPIVLKRAA
jgi:hypothetical protein